MSCVMPYLPSEVFSDLTAVCRKVLVSICSCRTINCTYTCDTIWNLIYICCLRLGFVHPLQDVALHQCLPLSSVCCFPNPGGSLLLLCRLAIFCLVVLLISSLSLVATLCSVWSTYCPSFLPYDRPISTVVSVCILWHQLSLFFSRFLSMVSYLVALDATFSFPLLSEHFSVCHLFL